jgi:hypothetical protein
MVLQDLGSALTGALAKLNRVSVVDEAVLQELLKEIAGALLKADVNAKVVFELRTNIIKSCDLEKLSKTGADTGRVIKKAVFDELVRLLTPERKPFVPQKGQANVFMFVGLQGAGKTTTIGKFANYWSRKGWKVCMVCSDTFRAGAFDQLKQNATRLRVPFYGSYTEPDPVKIAEEGVQQFRDEGTLRFIYFASVSPFDHLCVAHGLGMRLRPAMLQCILEYIMMDIVSFVMLYSSRAFDRATGSRDVRRLRKCAAEYIHTYIPTYIHTYIHT